MTFRKPKLEERRELDLAYIDVYGPYDQVRWDDLIPRLYAWSKEAKVMPGFHPMAIYHDDPKKVAPDRCRSQICISYKGLASSVGGIELMHLPAMKVVAYSFKGPADEYPGVYDMLGRWISDRGFRISGPCIEIYSKRPEVVDGVTVLYSKIMFPVDTSDTI